MDRPSEDLPSFWRSPAGLALVVALAVGGFYLVTEHTAHLLGALPYLIALACPLMHGFMHRGHSHGSYPRHGHSRSSEDEQQRR
jgi:hypothetical protein